MAPFLSMNCVSGLRHDAIDESFCLEVAMKKRYTDGDDDSEHSVIHGLIQGYVLT